MAFATPADLAAHLQQSFTAEETATAQQALDLATARIQGLTGRQFTAKVNDVVTLETDGGRDLRLPNTPVTSVASVVGRGLGSSTSVTYTATTDYELVGNRLVWSRGWPGGWAQLVTVTYSHGYATVPGDVKDACLEVAAQLFRNPDGMTTAALGDFRAEWDNPTELGPALAAVIRRYRRRVYSVRISA